MASFDIVPSDAIAGFAELVSGVGGDPEGLLRAARIDPRVMGRRNSILEYRAMASLFEIAATALAIPDFGMRLAVLQGGTRVMGPIGVVMKNSQTLGQALGYCARQIHAYSLATRVRFVPNRPRREVSVELQVLLDGPARGTQVIEHALLLAALNVIDITGGRARVRRVSFRHAPQCALGIYGAAFGCEVTFGASTDSVVFKERDLLCPVIGWDETLYEMATSFIDSHYPSGVPPMHARVRAMIRRCLGDEDCNGERIAEELCVHPRTLQRRLRREGESFESIKDEVRRDVAMRYLKRPELSFTLIAEKLGYAGQSALARSCHRWFSASPGELRARSQSPMSDHLPARSRTHPLDAHDPPSTGITVPVT